MSNASYLYVNVYNFVTRYKLHHALLWLTYLLFWFWVFKPGETLSSQFINSVIIVGTHATISYVNLLTLIPLFLSKRNYLLYSVSLLLLVSFGALLLMWLLFIVSPLPIAQKDALFSFGFFLNNAIAIAYTVGITMSFKFVKQWYEKEKQSQDLLRVNTETELKFLKSQINPHFLFNSLNSIYSLALQKSEKTPELVLKLSDILRYILYEGSEKYVDLETELRYLKSYVELEIARFGRNIAYEFVQLGNISQSQIAPMLLIPFVENAFKHGISTQNDLNFLKISSALEGNNFIFEITNSISAQPISAKENYIGGIGLENVKKRLQLLYPQSHTLNISQKKDTYNVTLKLELNEHTTD